MGAKDARQKLSEALYALKLAQVGFGRGPGGREVALAVTNAEQAEHWLSAAERVQEQASVGGTSEAPPNGTATTNPGA